FFSSRRRHTSFSRDWSSDVCSSDLGATVAFVNADTEERVPLFENDAQYLPPPNFKGAVGEKWYLETSLPNGNQYVSEVEIINPRSEERRVGKECRYRWGE